MTMRVSDYIARHLHSIGSRDVFLLSGGGMMHLIDAVGRVPGMRYHCNHHEMACAMAAEAYARLTHRLGVCYATSGPGATNILTGVVGAWIDSAPVLYITGQSNVRQSIRGSGIAGLRQYGTFEVDTVPIMQSVTKYAVFLDDPMMARYHLEKAIHLALSGRPGPVLLDIPLNVQGAQIDPDALQGYDLSADPTWSAPPALDPADVRDIVERLSHAERPKLLAGHGVRVAQAADLFREVIDALGIPVATTQLANDLLPYDHPLFVGHPGVKGDRPSGFALQNADVIVTLGCSLHAQTTGYDTHLFAPKAYKIQVDLDDAVLKRETSGVQKKVRCDVTSFLHALQGAIPKTANARHAPWREQCQAWKTKYSIMKEPHDFSDGPVNYYEFSDTLSRLLGGDEVIIADAGSAFYIFGQAFRCKGTQRYIASGGLATMGYTVPACIGTAAAAPDKTIIGLTGDGSFHMNVPELQTIRHENLNVKLFVLNNRGYSCIRNTQDTYFAGHHVGTEDESGVSFPPFDRIAHAYNLPYIRCGERSQLESTVRKALSTTGPVFVEVLCQFNQRFVPVLTSEKKADGTMEAKPIHDLSPFLSREELASNMQWSAA